MNNAGSNPRGDPRGPPGDLHGPLAVDNAGRYPRGDPPGGPRAICTALPVKSPDVFFWKRLRTHHKGKIVSERKRERETQQTHIIS